MFQCFIAFFFFYSWTTFYRMGILFTHSSVDENLVHLLLVALCLCIKLSLENLFWILLGRFLGVELLSYTVIFHLTYQGTIYHSSCAILNSRQQCVNVPMSPDPPWYSLSAIFQLTAILGVAMSHCVFNSGFPDDWWWWASFCIVFGHLDVFLGVRSIQVIYLYF